MGARAQRERQDSRRHHPLPLQGGRTTTKWPDSRTRWWVTQSTITC